MRVRLYEVWEYGNVILEWDEKFSNGMRVWELGGLGFVTWEYEGMNT